jgi:hypothetical protein
MAGLIAAAEVYVTEVKERLEKGYTSGAFVTGNNANAVARGEPEVSGDGVAIQVGSRQVDPPYPLYWELGFHSVFTGKYERVEVWVPTLMELRERMTRIVAEEIKAIDGAL